ncbi:MULTISPECIES: hypothetical protein [unclassified Streptomyces]|uniref:hypothetical protein n=1 Tax=unclassified Streptomyces TaxID=2593676 RepID=UPI002E10F4F9|nr:hypothetical protein OG457_07910 [Streptomyces sp. NBC_01207]WTA17154.1 hypothetical protein OG365_03330 [Streptomyces sp. NBC_00853]
MTSPASGAHTTHVHPPHLAGATPGTVIGVVERLNSRAEIQDIFPLIAETPHAVSLRRGERHLLRGWSPYIRLQPTVITGGSTPTTALAPPARASLPTTRTPRSSSSGWICLWQHADGQWEPRSMATDSPTTWDRYTRHLGLSTPHITPGTVWALQTGGANRAPACTILPSRTEMTLKPLSAALKGPLEVRPVADSGYTLLEALRTGRIPAALAIQTAWQQAPLAPGGRPSLFDLAVGYLLCRRGEVEEAQQWVQVLAAERTMGEGVADILAIRLWLAHRTRRRFDIRSVVEQLAEDRTLPMAAEGLRILADAMRLFAPDRRSERLASWQWLEHCFNSSAHTALTTYTAQSPDQPTRAPARRLPPPHEESLHFKLSPDGDGAHINWLPARALQQRMVAAQTWREPDMVGTHRSSATFTLIIRHRDPEWLWQFARQLMTRTDIRPALFRDTHTLELRLTPRDVADMGRELNTIREHVSDGRMTLSVPGVEYDVQGGLVGQLEDLLPGLRLGRGDDA